MSRLYHNADTVRTPYEAEVNEKLLNWRIAPGDAVVVVGGYDGATCDFILERFPQTEVYTFEPQPSFYGPLAARFADEPNVHVFPFALGNRNGTFPMVRQGGMFASFITGEHAQIEPAEPNGVGEMREWVEVMAELGIDRLAWFHSNIEGFEYVLMRHLIETGWIGRIGQMVVATHGMPVQHPDAWTWEQITEALQQTHHLMWRDMGWFAFEEGLA
jgi:FkbM family methyltransferase